MTTPAPAEELARLQQQIDRCDPETLADWLLARNAQHRARLTTACESLRADSKARAAAYERLAALASATARTAT